MPELVRLYVKNIAFGFGLALAFVGLLLWFNVANLWHLISTSDVGYIALSLLIVFNTIVFAGVQFAISVMRLADDSDSSGGLRDYPGSPERIAIRIPVETIDTRTQRDRQLHRRR
ncbi:hypothetical protein DL1_07510 [Thioclava dalianensis]|uniref:Uncharacterized protein n=1 Tax=Thioclava dalianensis TaxID=1185766 RepID=A0A074TIF2_9RHOB|nr:hypothetical protein [Thioclava dalianensis]KEP71424.1 hypothetical protein DL1_07510 [Thioclava dalianensis]SFM79689.1 hypothetical protein SAMN05216224_101349 [Thioclava dalianensis]